MYFSKSFKMISIFAVSFLSSLASADELLPLDFEAFQTRQCTIRCTPGDIQRMKVNINSEVCVMERVCNSDCEPVEEHHQNGTRIYDAQFGPWVQKCDASDVPISQRD